MMQATRVGALLVLVGCAGPAQQQQPAPPPQGQYIEFGVAVEERGGPPGSPDLIVQDSHDPSAAPAPAPAVAPAPPSPPTAPVTKDQPPHIKLKLGHYRSARFNFGVVVDRTFQNDNIADIDPIKVRFDGDPKIWTLQGQPGSRDRIDYVRDDGRVMLHVWDNGRMSVYVPDPDGGRSSDEIHLYRDGDADPL